MNTKRFVIAWAWGLLGLTLILALFVLTSQAARTAGPPLRPPDVANQVWDATLSYGSLAPVADRELVTCTAYITVPDRRQSCILPPDGLLSWWPGDGEVADIADGNDGTLQGGAGFAAGKVGQAFSFDGMDDRVNVGNAVNLHVSADEFTILAWVKFDTDDLWPIGDDMSVVDKMSSIGLNGDGWRLFRQRDNGNFMFCLGGGGVNGCDHWAPTPPTTVLATTVAQKDVWYHVAGVLGSSDFSIYVNGALEDSKPRPAFSDSNSTDLLIGANAPEGAYLDGLVDEVALFSRALTAAEIQEIFNAGSGGMCKTTGVILSPPAQTNQGARGQMVAHQETLVNATGGTDSFSLTLGTYAWDAALSTDSLGPIANGDSVTFTLYVTVPVGVDWYDTDTVVVTATSVTSPTVYSGTAEFTTQAYAPPEISTSPDMLTSTQYVNEIVQEALTISNGNGVTLTFQVLEPGALPVQEGLVAYFPFNGNANDESGNGYDGTVEGATLVADRFGNPDSAYSFDGVGDHYALDGTSTFNFLSGGFTLAAWVRFTQGAGIHGIIGKHDCGYPNGYFLSVFDSRFSFHVSGLPNLDTTETYNDGEWHLAVGVYDDVNQYLYVDSELKGSQQMLHTIPNGLDISIGRYRENCDHFNGVIDDVRIYNRALTGGEVLELYDWVASADVPWLSTDPITGTVPANSSIPVQVTFDATALQPGTYTSEIIIQSNDPVTPSVSVPVTMTIEPAANMGWVEGAVTDALTGDPLEASVVALGQPYTITTDPDTGSYTFWLNEGSFTLQASSERYVTQTVEVEIAAQQGTTQDFALVPVLWYVAPGGDDTNDCQTPTTPCATINGALAKPGFAISDSVLVAAGTYTGTGDEVVLIDKDATLSGGWDEAFTTQEGMSTIDGQQVRRGIRVDTDVSAVVERFAVQNGSGGIRNGGILALNNCTVSGNMDGGIYNADLVFPCYPSLTLNNSTVRGNTADEGAGIYNEGILALNNSTVSGNSAQYRGGGIYNSGVVYPARILILNNSTVSRNTAQEGGGIFAAGAVTLTNTILAGNSASGGPDCTWGRVDSFGYNLVGDTSDCTFAATTGDLIDVNPRLFTLVGLPGYHPLRPGSPAIDAGNPDGCTDHLSNPLDTDQRGIPRPLDGDGDGNAVCDMGAYEVDPEHPIRQLFLPIILRNYCPDFFDDFGNPASGWEVVDDEYVRSEYLGGEFRILTKRAGYFYFFRAPTCNRLNYTVEVDARWVGTPGASYGLVFGITSGFEQYYLFDINTDYRKFDLVRRDAGGFTQIVWPTYSAAINGGTASNHLKVTRNGDQITLEVNGTVLGTWSDGTIGGRTWAGLVTNPYSGNPTSDARFDNFSMASLPGSGASAQEPGGVMAEEGQLTVPNARRVPAPIDMGW